jgi:hypothetical protein
MSSLHYIARKYVRTLSLLYCLHYRLIYSVAPNRKGSTLRHAVYRIEELETTKILSVFVRIQAHY